MSTGVKRGIMQSLNQLYRTDNSRLELDNRKLHYRKMELEAQVAALEQSARDKAKKKQQDTWAARARKAAMYFRIVVKI